MVRLVGHYFSICHSITNNTILCIYRLCRNIRKRSTKQIILSFTKGDLGEELFKNYLLSKGHTDVEVTTGLFYDYDIAANFKGKRLTYEVKYDAQAYYWMRKRKAECINLYLEFRNTNKDKPSGIEMSKANYYVYIVKDEITVAFIFDTNKLREHLLNSDYPTAGNSANGDNNALGYIPPINKLLKKDSGFIKKILL